MARLLTRRNILTGTAALIGGLFALRWVRGADGGTPDATEGPFYPQPEMRHVDADNDLVKIAGKVIEAGGEVVRLEGRLVDREGKALDDHRIEIWQCDHNGRYLHPADTNGDAHDAGFQGFGHDITDAEGNFRFRTIRPVPYPGRTPHIHLKVFRQETELLTTQLYIDGHPGNSTDFLFFSMTTEQARSVSMVFDESAPEPLAKVTLVV